MEISRSINIMKALSDPSRLIILNSLINKQMYVEEIAERINLAVSTVSFHLKKLESADLVKKNKEQYYHVFRLNHELFNHSLKEIIDFSNPDSKEQIDRFEKYKQKILKTFTRKNKLLQIPVQKKKQVILLEFIASKFILGKQYREQEVDEILRNFYDDYVTLRRMLIDAGIMKRNNNIYQLIIKEEESMISRSEIKKQYKQTIQPMGIYIIKNKVNGKIFIGRSKNLNGKINSNKFQLKYGSHLNKGLQQDYNKYGEENFSFEVLDHLKPEDDLVKDYSKDLETLEELWMEKLQPYDEKGYNKRKIKS